MSAANHRGHRGSSGTSWPVSIDGAAELPKEYKDFELGHLEDAVKVVLRALESGCPKQFACHLAGMSTSWFYDKRKEDPHFEQLTDLAIAKGVAMRVKRISGHGQAHWQADAWLLSRTHPGAFAEPSVALSSAVSVNTGPTNIVVLGPERASLMVSRYETIRAKTRELVERSADSAPDSAPGTATD